MSRLLVIVVTVLFLVIPGVCRPTMTNGKDGSVLVYVPPGAFTMGSPQSVVTEQIETVHQHYPQFPAENIEIEMPPHQVTLPGYYIGKHEVTIGQYRQFLKETAGQPSREWLQCNQGKSELLPVSGVTLADAKAYCTWAGLRLPTEQEWEKAARGTDQRQWTWGDTFDTSLCRTSVGGDFASAGSPAPVGSFAQGASPFGCLDMIGNVCEWTASILRPYPGSRVELQAFAHQLPVVRGGSWRDDTPIWPRCADRYWRDPGEANNGMGFRVARDADN